MKNRSLVLYPLRDSEPEGTGSQGQTTQPSEPQQNDSERPAGPLPRHSSGIHTRIGDKNENCGGIRNCGGITITGGISPEALKILIESVPELSAMGGKDNKSCSEISDSRGVSVDYVDVGRNVGGIPSTTPHNSTH